MDLLPKMKAAAERLRSMLNFEPRKEWRAILDRLRGVCNDDPRVAGFAGFRRVQSRRIIYPTGQQFRAYGRADWYHAHSGEAKIAIESERKQHWPWPYRFTLIADDRTGLLPAHHVLPVMEVVPDFRLTMLELALDFAGEMTREEVRRHLLFGKTRPVASVGSTDYWGSRKGMKRGEFYFKKEIQVSRFELELPSRFLRHYAINGPFDFIKLVEILPSHISFSTLNEDKLRRRLNWMGLSASRQCEILEAIASLSGDLWPILNYLRDDVGMTNTRRLLDEDPRNQLIIEALKAWAAQWPTAPTRLKGRSHATK